MDWRTGIFGCVSVGLILPFVACDDTPLVTDGGTIAMNPDGGVTPASVCPSYMPAGALCGEGAQGFGTTVYTWAQTDPATKKVNKISWALPLTAINNVANAHADSRVWLHVPAQATTDTAMQGLAIDFLPKGHIPKGIYDTPHFEFHVIYQNFEETKLIDCGDVTMPADGIVTFPYVVLPPPDNCFPAMGIHAIDITAPEFNKAKFSISNLMVFWHGTMTSSSTALLRSMEPKATEETFLARKSFEWKDPPVLPPGSIGRATTTPSHIVADYDMANDVYVMTLSNFIPSN